MLKKFALGPRLGGKQNFGSDPLDTLREEIDVGAVPQPTGPDLMSTSQALIALDQEQAQFRAVRQQKNAAAAAGGDPQTKPEQPPMAPQPPLVFQKQLKAESLARLALALESDVGFTERLVWFWSNHFAVSTTKGQQTRATVGSYEREAIRPHVLGRFSDMLLAVELHPTMLFYLDNQLSIGPNSQAGLHRHRGLNENLGREILELHTLGVDGGYSQDDVVALAKMLTGYQIAGAESDFGEPGTTVFNPGLHEPGSVTFLNATYADTGSDQVRSALQWLAVHPSTARHVARKFAAHFLADTPDAGAVEKLQAVFLKTGGDLKALALSLIELPQARQTEGSKLRSPEEFVVAALRLCGLTADGSYGLFLRSLRALGQPLWEPSGPNGFYDDAAHWETPEGIKTRLDVASFIARRASTLDARTLTAQALGPLASAETVQTIGAAESQVQGIAMLLLSPEFQRR